MKSAWVIEDMLWEADEGTWMQIIESCQKEFQKIGVSEGLFLI